MRSRKTLRRRKRRENMFYLFLIVIDTSIGYLMYTIQNSKRFYRQKKRKKQTNEENEQSRMIRACLVISIESRTDCFITEY
jgi:hypothetical protein